MNAMPILVKRIQENHVCEECSLTPQLTVTFRNRTIFLCFNCAKYLLREFESTLSAIDEALEERA